MVISRLASFHWVVRYSKRADCDRQVQPSRAERISERDDGAVWFKLVFWADFTIHPTGIVHVSLGVAVGHHAILTAMAGVAKDKNAAAQLSRIVAIAYQ